MGGERSFVSFVELGDKVCCLTMAQLFSEVKAKGIAPDGPDGPIGSVGLIIFSTAGGLP